MRPERGIHRVGDGVDLGQQCLQRFHIVVSAVFVHQHEGVDIGLPQNVCELRLPEVRVDPDEHGADLRERHLEQDPFRQVPCEQGDVVAEPDAEGHQALCDPVRLVAQRGAGTP
jgi:hypothetical protein